MQSALLQSKRYTRYLGRLYRGRGSRAARSLRLRYGIALLAVALAWLATALLRVVSPERSLSLVFFFAAVAFGAGFGGLGPGVFATLLSALICDYFFLPPFHSLAVAGSDLPLLMLFIFVALLINGLSERLHAGTRAADRRFHDLVQGLDAIVWEADPRTLQFTFVSQRAEEILGYPVSGWLSDRDFRARLLHPDDRDRVMRAYREAVVQGDDHSFEYRALAADGREVWLRETLHVVHSEASQPVRVSGLCTDITERVRLFEQVRAGREHLHLLSRKLVDIQDAERRQIARELHDEIGQALTGLKLSLEMNTRLTAGVVQENLRQALTVVNELMVHVRDLSHDLRPAMLEDLGLLPTLLWYFDRYTSMTAVRVTFEHTRLERRFSSDVETTAYRIAQEALTNVARHARVEEVVVRIWSAGDLLGIQVVDEGCGFDPERVWAERNTSGLVGMEERAELLGGRLTVESTPGEGTCLTAELPVGTPSAAA